MNNYAGFVEGKRFLVLYSLNVENFEEMRDVTRVDELFEGLFSAINQ